MFGVQDEQLTILSSLAETVRLWLTMVENMFVFVCYSLLIFGAFCWAFDLGFVSIDADNILVAKFINLALSDGANRQPIDGLYLAMDAALVQIGDTYVGFVFGENSKFDVPILRNLVAASFVFYLSVNLAGSLSNLLPAKVFWFSAAMTVIARIAYINI